MSFFTSPLSSGKQGSTSTPPEPNVAHIGLEPVSASVVANLFARSLQRTGLDDIMFLSSTPVDTPYFHHLHAIQFNGVNPLRSGVLLQTAGYELYRPSAEAIANAYNFIGDLDCYTVWLLETDDGFIVAHEDHLIGYRSCLS